MKLTKPSYYDAFRCIAGACPDSCCKEWDVQVDGQAADYYRSLPGALGDRLRQVLRDTADGTVMTIENGRCPMWRADGLCRIQAELGEEALCRTCREFPRLTHDYGDFQELQLELSCPEAARLILSDTRDQQVREELSGGEAPEYDEEAMAILLASREQACAILSNEDYSVPQRLIQLLFYGYQVQSELDGEEPGAFDPAAVLDSGASLEEAADIRQVAEFFESLELLTPEWPSRLREIRTPVWDPRTAALGRYLVRRYWLQAVSDYDLVCRVKLAVIGCLLVCALGGDFVRTAQLFSKEIENNVDNLDAILDGTYENPALTDRKLLYWLRHSRQ